MNEPEIKREFTKYKTLIITKRILNKYKSRHKVDIISRNAPIHRRK